MSIKQQSINLILGLAIGAGGVAFLGSSHATAVAKDEKKEEKITNADYARSARAYLRKAHEDVDHCVNSASDRRRKVTRTPRKPSAPSTAPITPWSATSKPPKPRRRRNKQQLKAQVQPDG